MKILDLTNLEKSNIKYKISKFPDGQQNITITPFCYTEEGFGISLHSSPDIKFNVQNIKILIQSRLNNFLDLELIIATVAALREINIKEIHLFTPYFVGARSDRKFEEGGNWYLKQVICPIINSLNLTSITVIDPHSSVLGNLLKNFKSDTNLALVKFAVNSIYPKEASYAFGSGSTPIYPFVLVSPDAGASHKIEKIAKQIGFTRDIVTCSKERDENGELTKTVVPLKEGLWEKDFVIIDDICDGGRTFINIAEVIKNKYEGFSRIPKIYLIVTHGVFSGGFKYLSQYFDGIYCTNSYSDIGDYAGNDQEKTNVKQFKVI